MNKLCKTVKSGPRMHPGTRKALFSGRSRISAIGAVERISLSGTIAHTVKWTSGNYGAQPRVFTLAACGSNEHIPRGLSNFALTRLTNNLLSRILLCQC